MTDSPGANRSRGAYRHLPYWAFAIVVVVYLLIIQLGGRVIEQGSGDIFDTRGVVFTMVLPLGIALVFTYAVVAYLRWWRPLLRDDRPVRRWVWIVPALLAIAIILGIDYGALSDKGIGYIAVLLIATQIVGWGEEGMFRGIGVTMLREHGLTEGRVALWSSIAFGAVHLSNALGTGAAAIPQAVAVSFAGYFFYLTRRVSGGNALNSILHGLFDFAILSGTSITAGQGTYLGSLAPIAVYVVLAVILIIRRKAIEPASTGVRKRHPNPGAV